MNKLLIISLDVILIAINYYLLEYFMMTYQLQYIYYYHILQCHQHRNMLFIIYLHYAGSHIAIQYLFITLYKVISFTIKHYLHYIIISSVLQ